MMTNQQPLTVFLHIGLHKTGTTSFQQWLHEWRPVLADAGYEVYQSPDGNKSHFDLARSVLREGVIPIEDQGAIKARTRADIARWLDDATSPNIIFTSESLSMLRTFDECQALLDIFPPTVDNFVILLVLRDKKDWFESYKNQMIKSGRKPDADPRSWNTMNFDSWIADFEALIKSYNAVFDDVRTIDYDPDDTIANLMHEIAPELEIDTRFRRMNKSISRPEKYRGLRKFTRRIIGDERRGLVRHVLRLTGRL